MAESEMKDGDKFTIQGFFDKKKEGLYDFTAHIDLKEDEVVTDDDSN